MCSPSIVLTNFDLRCCSLGAVSIVLFRKDLSLVWSSLSRVFRLAASELQQSTRVPNTGIIRKPLSNILHACWEPNSFFRSKHFKLGHLCKLLGLSKCLYTLHDSFINLSCDISHMNAIHQYILVTLIFLLSYLLPIITTTSFLHQIAILPSCLSVIF